MSAPPRTKEFEVLTTVVRHDGLCQNCKKKPMNWILLGSLKQGEDKTWKAVCDSCFEKAHSEHESDFHGAIGPFGEDGRRCCFPRCKSHAVVFVSILLQNGGDDWNLCADHTIAFFLQEKDRAEAIIDRLAGKKI